MTDTCGLANSGTTATGLLMQLRNSGQPYVPSYMASPSTNFGNSIVYPGIVGYYGEANGTSEVYPDLNKSTTVSMYLWANSAPSSSYVNVLEYGYYIGNYYYQCLRAQMYVWPQMSINLVGNLAGCASASCKYTCSSTTITYGKWNQVSFVYNAVSSTVSLFLNGVQQCESFYMNAFSAAAASKQWWVF